MMQMQTSFVIFLAWFCLGFISTHCLEEESAITSKKVGGEANGKTFTMDCGETGVIRIVSASWGRNCANPQPPLNNQLSYLGAACDGHASCTYTVVRDNIGGDASPGCRKDYDYEYRCVTQVGAVPGEANGKTFTMDCGYPGLIDIVSASWGQNCNPQPPFDNQLSYLSAACDQRASCTYKVVRDNIGGDPAVGCRKDYDYKYRCVTQTAKVPGEANGKTFTIDCRDVAGAVIKIVSASWGRNCANPQPPLDNQLSYLSAACDQRTSCTYKVVRDNIGGDAAPGCAKDYDYEYQCELGDEAGNEDQVEQEESAIISKKVGGEANGKTFTMDCGETGVIRIVSASWGQNCNPTPPKDNQLSYLGAACDGHASCTYKVVRDNIGGDPAVGCRKDYDYEYRCVTQVGAVPGEANGKTFTIDCGYPGLIDIVSASWGQNCNPLPPFDNQLSYLSAACDQRASCTYKVVRDAIGGDPAVGCPKDYDYKYRCVTQTAKVPGEANGKTFTIDCRDVAGAEIKIVSASWGRNCANPQPPLDNQISYLSAACDGRSTCTYKVVRDNIGGDAAPGCAKDYDYEYHCELPARQDSPTIILFPVYVFAFGLGAGAFLFYLLNAFVFGKCKNKNKKKKHHVVSFTDSASDTELKV